MTWYMPSTWSWVVNRRKRKELAAIDHLRRALETEQKRLEPLRAVVAQIEVKLNAGDFEEAEKLTVSNLIPMMEQKKLLDQLEKVDFGRFKGTLLRDLRARLQRVRAA